MAVLFLNACSQEITKPNQIINDQDQQLVLNSSAKNPLKLQNQGIVGRQVEFNFDKTHFKDKNLQCTLKFGDNKSISKKCHDLVNIKHIYNTENLFYPELIIKDTKNKNEIKFKSEILINPEFNLYTKPIISNDKQKQDFINKMLSLNMLLKN